MSIVLFYRFWNYPFSRKLIVNSSQKIKSKIFISCESLELRQKLVIATREAGSTARRIWTRPFQSLGGRSEQILKMHGASFTERELSHRTPCWATRTWNTVRSTWSKKAFIKKMFERRNATRSIWPTITSGTNGFSTETGQKVRSDYPLCRVRIYSKLFFVFTKYIDIDFIDIHYRHFVFIKYN